jgi:hypothetical protein
MPYYSKVTVKIFTYLDILVGRRLMTQPGRGSLRKCHGQVEVHTSVGSPSQVSFRWEPVKLCGFFILV